MMNEQIYICFNGTNDFLTLEYSMRIYVLKVNILYISRESTSLTYTRKCV